MVVKQYSESIEGHEINSFYLEMSHLTISGIVHMFCVRKEMISDGDK